MDRRAFYHLACSVSPCPAVRHTYRRGRLELDPITGYPARVIQPPHTKPLTTDVRPSLLLVDDDPLIRESLHMALSDEFDIHLAEDRSQAVQLVRELADPPQLALVDLGLPPTPHRPQEGFRLIAELLAHAPDIKIITLSGQSDEGNARHARALGAFEFVAKPSKPETLRAELRAALIAQHSERRSAAYNEQQLGIIGDSLPIRTMRDQIRLYANTPYPVLIQGESGSGKELVAAALQRLSRDPSAPLHRHQLCRHRPQPARIHPVRPRQRGFHRCNDRPSRIL